MFHCYIGAQLNNTRWSIQKTGQVENCNLYRHQGILSLMIGGERYGSAPLFGVKGFVVCS
jgi:hypothetical protein